MFLAAHAAPRRRRRRFFCPPPTEIYRRAAADTMTSAHSSSLKSANSRETHQRRTKIIDLNSFHAPMEKRGGKANELTLSSQNVNLLQQFYIAPLQGSLLRSASWLTSVKQCGLKARKKQS